MEHYTLYRQVTRNIRHEVSTWRRWWDVKQPWTCQNTCFVSTWPRKKKHAPTIWTHIDGNQRSIPPMSPLHPRTKIYGLLKGLLANHDPLIQRLTELGRKGGIPYDQRKNARTASTASHLGLFSEVDFGGDGEIRMEIAMHLLGACSCQWIVGLKTYFLL